MKMPQSWDEVTVKQYLLLQDNKKFNNKIDQEINNISILSNAPIEEVRELFIDDFNQAVKSMAFMNSPIPENVKWRFTLNGKKYEFIMTADEMTAGQMADFTTVSQEGKPEDSMHKLLACAVLVDGKYQGYTKICNEIYEHMPISIALPYYLFFYEVGKRLPEGILTYLGKKRKRRKKRTTAGAGTTPLNG